MNKRRTKYPLPSHILSYSETTPKERECSNGKSEANNERTKNEQKTVRAARANKERRRKPPPYTYPAFAGFLQRGNYSDVKTNKRRTKDGASRTGK